MVVVLTLTPLSSRFRYFVGVMRYPRASSQLLMITPAILHQLFTYPCDVSACSPCMFALYHRRFSGAPTIIVRTSQIVVLLILCCLRPSALTKFTVFEKRLLFFEPSSYAINSGIDVNTFTLLHESSKCDPYMLRNSTSQSCLVLTPIYT